MEEGGGFFGIATDRENQNILDLRVLDQGFETMELGFGDRHAAVLFEVEHFFVEVFVVVDLDVGAIELPLCPVGSEVAFGPVGVVMAEVEADAGVSFFDVGAHLEDELGQVLGAIGLAGQVGVVAKVVVPLDGVDFGIFADEF